MFLTDFHIRPTKSKFRTYSTPYSYVRAKNMARQECIPVGCIPPAAVAIGGFPPGTPLGPDPTRPGTPLDQIPLGPDPPTRHPSPRDQAPHCGQTHTCKHITLPVTSFGGGKNADNYNFRHHFAQSIV